MPSVRWSEPVDALALQGRVRTLRIGAWPSAFTCLYFALYELHTWERPHRTPLLVLCLWTLLASISLARAPIEPLVRGRWREPFFYAWSACIIGLITLGAALDGGVRSPLALAFFLPLAYAALSYPLTTMLAVAVTNLVAFVGLAVLGGEASTTFVAVFGATLVSEAWICAWQAHNLGVQRRELAHISRADPLTGALNRRGFGERLAGHLGDARRHGRPLTLVVLDLDHFKLVNDTRGHAAGDELLRWVVTTLGAHLRPGDSLGRLGGDEFALVLDQHPDRALPIVERLLDVLAERTAVSAGLASFPLDGLTAEELHHAADLELYARKRGERRAPPRSGELSWAAALAGCVDERMAVQHEHSMTVAGLSAAIAERLDWPEADLGLLRLAATLHDVGKITVPERILRKPGPLTDEEWEQMARHPVAGAEIVSRIEGLGLAAEWIRHSHERVDGHGYPDGLTGDDIPAASRILLVADAYDAMTTDRPYRRAWSSERALAELRRHAGTQFDPDCVAVLGAHLAAEAGSVVG